MSIPSIAMTSMHQPPRVSAYAAEQMWRCVCAVIGSGLDLSDATVTELSRHAADLRDQIPAARLEQIDAEKLARARN